MEWRRAHLWGSRPTDYKRPWRVRRAVQALKDSYGTGGRYDKDRTGNPVWPATTHMVASIFASQPGVAARHMQKHNYLCIPRVVDFKMQ